MKRTFKLSNFQTFKLSAITLSLWLACACLSMGQNRIDGCVRDESGRALANAEVYLSQNDSLSAGVITDRKGCFSLSLEAGQYVLHVSHLGYETYMDTIALQANLSLEAIVLGEEALALDEVAVSADRRLHETRLNRNIFNVPSRTKRAATDAFQILSQVPSLIVDGERGVSLVGSDNTIVMVNHVKRSADFLRTLRPEDIDRIEVVRNPGAYYASKNIDGIVDIITKAPVGGQSLYASLQLNPQLRYTNYSAGYTRVSDKWNLSLSGSNFSFKEENRDFRLERDADSNGATYHTERWADKQRFRMQSPVISLSADYLPSPKDFFTINTSYIYSPMSNTMPYNGFVSVDNQKLYDFEALNDSESKFSSYKANAYYQHDFSSNRSLSIEADFGSVGNNSSSIYRESSQSGGPAYENVLTEDDRNSSLDAQANYRHKLDKLQWEGGYRIYWQQSNINSLINGTSGAMKYVEWRNNLYLNLLGQWGEKWVYQAGIGLDLVRTDVNSQYRNRFNELTPNAMLRYNINAKHNISLDFLRTRQSPAYSMLNPSPSFLDTTRIVKGNPMLTPYYLNRLRLSYEWMHSKFYIWMSVQYRVTNGYVNQLSAIDDQGVLHVTFANTARNTALRFMLNPSLNLLPGWGVQINASMEYRMFEDPQQKQLNKNYWEPNIFLFSWYNYKRWSVTLNGIPVKIRIPNMTGYSTYINESQLEISYRINNNWSVNGGARYLAVAMENLGSTRTDGYSEFYRDTKTDRRWRVLLGVNYRFQKGKQKGYKQKSSKTYEDQVSRDKEVY
ncbi:MAG: TonB-dependent receptor [Tannerellaceae bacterium]|jgi:hypothetical protein|nr:TonB-dependent receptor [Tannerellaceae bacterium]